MEQKLKLLYLGPRHINLRGKYHNGVQNNSYI